MTLNLYIRNNKIGEKGGNELYSILSKLNNIISLKLKLTEIGMG